MHMHVPTKLLQYVATGEVGRKSTRGGEGRGGEGNLRMVFRVVSKETFPAVIPREDNATH